MAPSNSQHNAIMRVYSQKQLKNRHEQDERVHRACEWIPQIHNLEQEISTRAVQYTRRLLDRDENVKEGLK